MHSEFTAQHSEDKWLADNWHGLGLPEAGFFVEFGAGDGKEFSNTFWLEHTKGWTGLLCEPDPRQDKKKLKRIRPNSIVEKCCIGPYDVVSFGLCHDPLLSGEFRTNNLGNNTEPNQKRLSVINRVSVNQVPLTSLLSKHAVRKVDVLSVDTEGSELYALGSLDWMRWSPKVCIVELSTWGLKDSEKYGEANKEFMLARGYKLAHETQCNGIFVRG